MSRLNYKKVGIFDHTLGSYGGAQLVNACMAEILSKNHDVEIIHFGNNYDLSMLSRAFDLDLKNVKERRMDQFIDSFNIPGPRPFYRQILDYHSLSSPYDLFIYSGHSVPPFCRAKFGMVYCHFPIEYPFQPSKEIINEKWLKRHQLDRYLRKYLYNLLWNFRMRRYGVVIANSIFTSGWIEHRFRKQPVVLYPPVPVRYPSNDKENLIVSIGRFTVGRRSKNQHLQIKAFKEVLKKVSGKWELCLIGSCNEHEAEKNYLTSLRNEAKDLPVRFLINSDSDEINRFLAKASLFWHTCGLFNDELQYPENAEHFGIATVEAMGSGCVPVVISSGGQSEIVENNISGYLCKSLGELIEKTIYLIRNSKDLARMRLSSIKRSTKYSKNVFKNGFIEIFDKITKQ